MAISINIDGNNYEINGLDHPAEEETAKKLLAEITKPTKKQNEDYMAKFGVLMPENFIEVNCYMIDEKEILNNPNLTGDYNVPRYLNNFNKKKNIKNKSNRKKNNEDISYLTHFMFSYKPRHIVNNLSLEKLEYNYSFDIPQYISIDSLKETSGT